MLLQVDDGGLSWAESIMIVGVLFVLALPVIVVIWQGLATWRARMSIAREAAYKTLAEDAARVQRETLAELRKASADLADLRQRTAELERILKEVE